MVDELSQKWYIWNIIVLPETKQWQRILNTNEGLLKEIKLRPKKSHGASNIWVYDHKSRK